MAKYKITFDRANCIGAAACIAACPDFWSMQPDGKASLKGAKKTDGGEELDIDEPALECNRTAAEVCPVRVIHLKNLESGEQVV